jgi:hypothetical protein
MDVVAVERRHERAVLEVDQLAREPVALVLGLPDVAEALAILRPLLEQLDEQPRDLARVRRRACEEIEELALLRPEPDSGHRRFLPDRHISGRQNYETAK